VIPRKSEGVKGFEILSTIMGFRLWNQLHDALQISLLCLSIYYIKHQFIWFHRRYFCKKKCFFVITCSKSSHLDHFPWIIPKQPRLGCEEAGHTHGVPRKPSLVAPPHNVFGGHPELASLLAPTPPMPSLSPSPPRRAPAIANSSQAI
jgi:hypothetical protein